MQIDEKALREKAEAATPGPWIHNVGDSFVYCRPVGRPIAEEMEKENAAFIAAANPAVVLALLDKLDALKAENETLKDLLVEDKIMFDLMGCHCPRSMECDCGMKNRNQANHRIEKSEEALARIRAVMGENP